MKRFFNALMYTGLVILGVLIVIIFAFIWSDFVNSLDLTPDVTLLLSLTPSIVAGAVSCFCLFYFGGTSKKEDACCKDISNEADRDESNDSNISLAQVIQDNSRPSRPILKFVCPPGFEAVAIEYFKDTNVEVVFPDPIKVKEFHGYIK